MRIRFKPWARGELEASPFYVNNPQEDKNKWKSIYKNADKPFYLELGCGKGGFISQMALLHPEINFLAIDMVDAMLGLAKRKIEEAYGQAEKEVDNVLLTRYDIERIDGILGEKDRVERIYINFCNPWPRGKHHKKRLTHPKQLEKYREFLVEGGEIYFKTDDTNLFGNSVSYFQQAGFAILKQTENLAEEKEFWENIQTEHEKMFMEQGIAIKAIIAKKV